MSANDRQEGGEHYKRFQQHQPWDVLQSWLTPEEYRGYMKGTIIVYLAREQQKGGDLDLKKVAHYSEKLVEVISMKKLRPTEYCSVEGGTWHLWHAGSISTEDLVIGVYPKVLDRTPVFALRFGDGRIWDCLTGWRK